jgi:hypothetical protein
MKKYFTIALLFAALLCNAQVQPLKISANKRFLQTADGKPFFWLGDTGWLLFIKCNREDAIKYLDDRKQKGFNVIQVMVVHDINLGTNAYGDLSVKNKDVSQPITTPGKSFANAQQYDFWDHVDFVIDEAAKRGIYMALVPVWGSNIKDVTVQQAASYAEFLAKRYKSKSNIIWLNGGDIKGGDALDKWNVIGNTIRGIDKKHLMTFHPRGRNSSSVWFHNASWLDFNMFQSGHRSYAQDTLSTEKLHYGEDNWKYANDDYVLAPVKPTLDGEPSYEDIPYGLHKADQPYWQDHEIRRYAYWSVFAGGFGFTYGQNAVMQFYTPGDSGISYFPRQKWQDGLNASGAGQMQHLKKLLLSKSYFDRVPAQELIVDNGEKYNRILCTSGNVYAMFYVYNGRSFEVNTGRMGFQVIKTSWFNPRNGRSQNIHIDRNMDTQVFIPPGKPGNGNDWVLIIEKVPFKHY